MFLQTTYWRHHSSHVGLVIIMLVSFMVSSKTFAAQPTATIISLTGIVQVIFQSGEALIATTGLSLEAGDILETQHGAEVVLEFSDGSQLQLSENTRLNLADLLENVDTGARTSVVKLAWGKFRAILSPGHQEKGSAFSVETPNSLVGVKFSQPVITVGYDPDTDTTTIDAETVDVVVTNLRTQRTQLLLRGQRGIVRKDTISAGGGQKSSSSQDAQPRNQDGQSPSPEAQPSVPPGPAAPGLTPPPTAPPLPGDGNLPPPQPESGLRPGQPQVPQPQQPMNRNAFAPAQRGIRAATGSTVPTSIGVIGVRQPGQPGEPGQPAGGAGAPPGPGGVPQPVGGGIGHIGQLPQPGTRPQTPENRQQRIIIIHLREQ